MFPYQTKRFLNASDGNKEITANNLLNVSQDISELVNEQTALTNRVDNLILGVSSVNTKTGAVVLSSSDILGAPAINTSAGDSATINALSGRFRKKSTSGTDFTLTNSFITANSIILLTFASVPGAAGYDAPIVVASAGSAIIYFKTASVAAAPSNNVDVNFLIIN